ncbi:carbohydrate esterase family 4 protein [Mycena epipterygia]|nr:carbohydrate esterase family 4 protein [Mycena epipterygia]
MLRKTFTLLLAALLASAGPVLDRAAPKAVVYESCVVNNTVALTFDDGPYIYMTNVSEMLTQYGAKGTFFVNGNNYDCIYDEDVAARLQHAYNAGHQISSHTWSHPDLKKLNASEITDQIVSLNTAFKAVLGMRPNFLRPPYGNYNTLVRQQAAAQNISLVTWDFDSGDSVGVNYTQSETDYNNTIASRPSTLLALNHETEVNTVKYLVEFAIKKFQAAGYKLVTVAECLGLEPYAFVGQPGTRDDTWDCPDDDDN